MPRSTPTTEQPRTLDYALPRIRGGSRPRPSLYIAICALVLSALLLFFVSAHTDTGVPFANPPRVYGTYAVWGLAILYLWQRLREDTRWPCVGLAAIGVAATVAVVAVPMQVLLWRADPGHPQSRFRLTLWPLACAVLGFVVAAIGDRMTRRPREREPRV